MSSNRTSEELITELKTGGILYKVHHSKEEEFLFLSGSTLENRGWATAYGKPSDRLLEIVLRPQDWYVHEHHISEGHPYPWSIGYIRKSK